MPEDNNVVIKPVFKTVINVDLNPAPITISTILTENQSEEDEESIEEK